MTAPWIQLRSGAAYEYGSPRCEGLSLALDIAKPLSRIARYLGHTTVPWSVAAHAVCCARFAAVKGWSHELQWLCLHHDDHEALIGDMPAPMKRWLGMNLYTRGQLWALRDAADEALLDAFVGDGYRLPMNDDERALIKKADLALLMGEAHELMVDSGDDPFDEFGVKGTGRPPRQLPKDWGVPVDEGDRIIAQAVVNKYLTQCDGWGPDAENEYLLTDHELRVAMGWRVE